MLSDAEISEFIWANEVKNAVKQKAIDLSTWNRWCDTIHVEKKCDIPSENLNTPLSRYFVKTRSLSGNEYMNWTRLLEYKGA